MHGSWKRHFTAERLSAMRLRISAAVIAGQVILAIIAERLSAMRQVTGGGDSRASSLGKLCCCRGNSLEPPILGRNAGKRSDGTDGEAATALLSKYAVLCQVRDVIH